MAEFVLSGQELFGRYARIAYGHALDGKQDYHIYKCIQSFRSNCYCDVPLTYQTENNCYNHDDIVDVVNVIHCGIDESRVIRVARNDIELLPAPDVEPVRYGRWERCGGDLHSSGYAIYCSICNKTHFVHYKYSLGGLYGCKELFEKPKYCPSCGAFMEFEEGLTEKELLRYCKRNWVKEKCKSEERSGLQVF